jgi:hypothetical protein
VFYGQFLNLETRDGEYQIPLLAQYVVSLRATRPEAAETDRFSFDLWDEKGGQVSKLGVPATTRWLLPEGTYVARATCGALTSPLAAFRVDAAAPTPVDLALQPCPDFSLRFSDPQGSPLGTLFLNLGTEATASFPRPCRLHLFCENGEVAFTQIVPGTYDVEFAPDMSPHFTRRLELRPDLGTIVVASR